MGQAFASVAAATAVLTYDLLQNVREKRMMNIDRLVRGIKLCGSAAANDTQVELFVETERVGAFNNTNTGLGNADDIQPIGFVVRAGEQISVIVTDAPATNPINLTIMYDDYPPGSL